MPTQADWLLVSEFLDAVYDCTRVECRAIYAEHLTNRQQQLTYHIVKSSNFIHRSHGKPVAPQRSTRYNATTSRLEFFDAMSSLCDAIPLPGIIAEVPQSRFSYVSEPWLEYLIQRKFTYFGRGESEYTDEFCARAVPDLARVTEAFVRRRKLLTLLDVLES